MRAYIPPFNTAQSNKNKQRWKGKGNSTLKVCSVQQYCSMLLEGAFLPLIHVHPPTNPTHVMPDRSPTQLATKSKHTRHQRHRLAAFFYVCIYEGNIPPQGMGGMGEAKNRLYWLIPFNPSQKKIRPYSRILYFPSLHHIDLAVPLPTIPDFWDLPLAFRMRHCIHSHMYTLLVLRIKNAKVTQVRRCKCSFNI